MSKQSNNNIKISTIIPVFNSERYIEDTLDSIVKQTYMPYEILIIDDASNDNTFNICKRLQKIYKNIKVISLKKNMGVSYVRNLGIKKARGNYIHFIDADDTIEKNMYEDIIANISAEKDIIITGSIHNERNEKYKYIPKFKNITDTNELKDFLLTNCISGRRDIFNFVWNKLYKVEFLKKNDIKFDENVYLGEDFLFNCKCFKTTNNILVLNKAYYNYMRRPNHITLKMKFRDNEIELRKLFYKTWIDLYKYYDIYDEVANDMAVYEGYKIYNAITSITNKNCPLEYGKKIEYINNFLDFENTDCLYKYMETKEDLVNQLNYLKSNNIQEFYETIKKDLNNIDSLI